VGKYPLSFGQIGRRNFSHWTYDCDWPVTVRPTSTVVCPPPPPTYSSEDWKRSFPKLVSFSGITTDDLQVLKASNVRWNQSLCLKSSGMWWCVVGWGVAVGSEDHSAFIWRLQQSGHHMQHLCGGLRCHPWLMLVISYTHTHTSGHQICRCVMISIASFTWLNTQTEPSQLTDTVHSWKLNIHCTQL